MGRGLHGLRVSPNDTAPLIAVTAVGEKSEGDSFHGSESCRGEVFVQCAARAVGLIEAPERCRDIERLKAITHLKEQLV